MALTAQEIDKKLQEFEEKTDHEKRSDQAQCVNNMDEVQPWWHLVKYLVMGALFGIVLVKSQVISWFRIQEMFRLQSFHMFGVIGSAIAVGMLSVILIKKFKVKTIYGEPITIPNKTLNKGQVYGGLIFGLGWAMTGACPGPLFAQIGTGATAVIVTLFMAIVGTWIYGFFREKLPH